jgi:hypothetical protein
MFNIAGLQQKTIGPILTQRIGVDIGFLGHQASTAKLLPIQVHTLGNAPLDNQPFLVHVRPR